MAVQPFDDFGRRTIKISTAQGPVDVIQGITLITPHWTRIEGLKAGANIVWDMRIATSSIPRDLILAIHKKNVRDPKDIDERLKIVRLFIEADRFRDAEVALEAIAADFPRDDLPAKVAGTLRQQGSKVLLRELDLRQKSGQHRLAYALLNQFPEKDIPGTVMQLVKQEITAYDEKEKLRVRYIEELKALYNQLNDATYQLEWKEALEEIYAELGFETLDRLAAFDNIRKGNAGLTPDQQMAIAVSGWLLTSDRAATNTKATLSLYQTRNLIRKYMMAKTPGEREDYYKQIASEEANSPALISKLIASMKPVWPMPKRETAQDALQLSVAGSPGQPDYDYDILLPLEYDPYRAYPAIVCLHAQGMTPDSELDWWAGAKSEKGRLGQATRQGYIVIAPHYALPNQVEFEGTAMQHDIVTRTLRDACRRFNIDSDRVYLSGHSMGASAAWEIGLSHPDLWAGVIPINGAARKDPVQFYKSNAANVPFYFVSGELDCGVIGANAVNWDWYFSRNYDTTVVEYLGRGHEHFSDEILRLFDWMGRKNRGTEGRLYPKSAKVTTKRPTDNYFWSLEVHDFGGVSKLERGIELAVEHRGNSVIVKAPGNISIWLGPEQIDFTKAVNVMHNNKNLTGGRPITPDLRTILEDVRTRGERRHPFWVQVKS
ncbi:MAG: peptidase [Pirellulales bacterium]